MRGVKTETEFYSGTGLAIFYQNRGFFLPKEQDEI